MRGGRLPPGRDRSPCRFEFAFHYCRERSRIFAARFARQIPGKRVEGAVRLPPVSRKDREAFRPPPFHPQGCRCFIPTHAFLGLVPRTQPSAGVVKGMGCESRPPSRDRTRRTLGPRQLGFASAEENTVVFVYHELEIARKKLSAHAEARTHTGRSSIQRNGAQCKFRPGTPPSSAMVDPAAAITFPPVSHAEGLARVVNRR